MSSAYDGHLSREGISVSEEEVQAMAKQKAHELFSVCDIEQKGFITKRDMQRLQNELPLNPDQLEAVFDSLDDDGNGYLTLEEFTEGFGSYLGINFMGDSTMEADDTLENVYEGEEKQEEEKQFTDMMENIGAKSVFDDENTIKQLWMKIRRDEPEMVGNFEEFLYKISSDLRKTKVDFDTLENALKSKSTAHDEEVRKLYEEMEYQIKREKERILSEEQLKERQMRETLEKDLEEKDKQLQDLLSKHQEMENRLEQLNQVETETKQENEKLAKEKEELEDMLMKSQEGLEDSKMYIDQLRKQQKHDKQERARAAIKLTETIALERESLVKQLDTLKDVNKKLRDDKDEAEIRRDGTSINEEDDLEILEAEASPSKSNRKKDLCKQGSILGDYFPPSRGKFESTAESIEESLELEPNDGFTDDDIECDDDDDLINNECENLNNNNKLLYGDSDNNLKPSYYGYSEKSKLDHSDESENDDVDNKGSRSARHKSKRKKPGFNPSRMHTKRSVTPPSGDGDSFEEEGDNIDMIVAPAFEDTITSGQTGEHLSMYFKNFQNSKSNSSVEMQSIAIQTIEEMVPKSEVQKLAKALSKDSSTNTSNLDLYSIGVTSSVDCSTNTDFPAILTSNSTNTDFSEGNKTSSSTNTDFPEENLTSNSTNTNILEGKATDNNILEGIGISNLTYGDISEENVISSLSNTGHSENGTISNKTDLDSEPNCKQNSSIVPTETQRLKSQSQPYVNSPIICDGLDLAEHVDEIPELKQHHKNIEMQHNNNSGRNRNQLLRKSRVKGSESDDNSVEMRNFTHSVGISPGNYDVRNVKPLIGPLTETIGVHENDLDTVQGTRGQPVGADIQTEEQGPESTVGMRQRIFKIVFVGDSGVGKSSVIHRFCNNHFNPTFSATIGVDFQVKTLIMGGQSIVLQLWDTAGQERFRSITKQYFRKADGVVIMYDVNTESTFTNVRNWMESVQEGVEEGTVILLLGNKTDMSESESERPVKIRDGNKLAVGYDAIFYETSAKSGVNIKESMEAMANILKEKEDKEIEKSLNLDDKAVKKKFCCG